jgi:protein arginine kinase activator
VIPCEKCQKREATRQDSVRLPDGAGWSTRHLCQECAEGEGGPAVHPAALVHALIQGVGAMLAVPDSRPDRTCPSCGITWQEFRRKGRLGCPADYDHFQPEIEEVLARIHGRTRHEGRVAEGSVLASAVPEGPPAPAPAAAAPPPAPPPAAPRAAPSPLADARRRLKVAVADENYEEAMALRDRIRELEKEARATGAAGAAPSPGGTSDTGSGDDGPPSKGGGRKGGGRTPPRKRPSK